MVTTTKNNEGLESIDKILRNLKLSSDYYNREVSEEEHIRISNRREL